MLAEKATLYLQQQRGDMRCKSANWRETVMWRLVYRKVGEFLMTTHAVREVARNGWGEWVFIMVWTALKYE